MRPLLAILMLVPFWCGAATVVTKTIQPSGGDYTTLSAWEAGRQADLVSADTIEIGQINGSWASPDTTAVVIAGWTTDATRYIVVTNSGSKHGGTWGTANAYLLSTTAGAIALYEDFVRLYGLQVLVTTTSASVHCISTVTLGSPAEVIIGQCLFKAIYTGSGYGYPTLNSASGCTMSIFNSVAFGFTGSSSRGFTATAGVNRWMNLTSYGNYYNYRAAGGTVYATNCISQADGSDGFNGTFTGDYNVSDRASDAPSASYRSGLATTVTFTDAANGNFHTSDSDVVGVGFTSPLGSLYSTDFEEESRTGSWDIGADEYASASMRPQILIVTE